MILPVQAGTQQYDIVLEAGVLPRAGEYFDLHRRVLVVTDDGVPASYAALVAAACDAPTCLTLPQGEKTKCFASLERLLSAMLAAGLTRKDCVVAVGGGVVGDLSGFAASCYMRGIDFYNIPTTLLAQVDSSVGGKTAIDFGGVKNSVGAFYPPHGVLIDPSTLQTLSPRQRSAGLAEAIKMAATSDAALFSVLETCEDLTAALPEIIHRALCIKRDVVQQDPKETGLRRVLNFGHTVGHAIESEAGGRLLHGECVALGMLPMSAPAVRERLRAVLARYDLPTKIEASPAALLPYLLHDKKMGRDTVTAVCVDEIGSFRFAERTPAEILHDLEQLV